MRQSSLAIRATKINEGRDSHRTGTSYPVVSSPLADLLQIKHHQPLLIMEQILPLFQVDGRSFSDRDLGKGFKINNQGQAWMEHVYVRTSNDVSKVPNVRSEAHVTLLDSAERVIWTLKAICL